MPSVARWMITVWLNTHLLFIKRQEIVCLYSEYIKSVYICSIYHISYNFAQQYCIICLFSVWLLHKCVVVALDLSLSFLPPNSVRISDIKTTTQKHATFVTYSSCNKCVLLGCVWVWVWCSSVFCVFNIVWCLCVLLCVRFKHLTFSCRHVINRTIFYYTPTSSPNANTNHFCQHTMIMMNGTL